jgi:hypothetical protein
MSSFGWLSAVVLSGAAPHRSVRTIFHCLNQIWSPSGIKDNNIAMLSSRLSILETLTKFMSTSRVRAPGHSVMRELTFPVQSDVHATSRYTVN